LGLRQKRFALAVLRFGAAHFGNVLDHGEESRGFSGFVRQSDAADKYNALATVRKIVASLGFERRAMLDCGVNDAANSRTVFGMNHAEHGFFARDAVVGIESVNAEEFGGPDALRGGDIVFPAAGAGDLLGMHEQCLSLAEGVLGKVTFGDVAHEEANGMRLLGTTPDRRNAGLKPAAAGREVDGEFDIFANALLDDSAE
jgi:hypothetical protein